MIVSALGPMAAARGPDFTDAFDDLDGLPPGFFDGAVSVVPFLDAGSVSQDVIPDFDEIKLGVGVGLRYHTGFGPLRLDVGVPLNPGPDDSPVAVYVSLGQAF